MWYWHNVSIKRQKGGGEARWSEGRVCLTDGYNDQRLAKALACAIKSLIGVWVGMRSNLFESVSVTSSDYPPGHRTRTKHQRHRSSTMWKHQLVLIWCEAFSFKKGWLVLVYPLLAPSSLPASKSALIVGIIICLSIHPCPFIHFLTHFLTYSWPLTTLR